MALNLESLFSLLSSSPTEQDCIDYLEKIVWDGKLPTSPFDPTSKVYPCANNQYRCKNTGKYFNVRSTTIFRNSNISLRKWFVALYLLSSQKKGISSCQLAKFLKITQKSVWFMLHRLRHSFESSIFKDMLKGFVEIDETYLGGSNPNRHWNKKVPGCQGRNWKDKTPLLVMIERGGNVIVLVVPNVERNTLEPIIGKYVKKGSNVSTDEWLAYNKLHKNFNHQRVIHKIKQYVNGDASTNSAENFNSHLKRGVYGIYHQVSRKHTQSYANEFAFRYNTRKYEEQKRFDLVLSSSVGKSLSYRELISSF